MFCMNFIIVHYVMKERKRQVIKDFFRIKEKKLTYDKKCVRVIKAVKAARDRKEEYPLSP